MRGERRESTPQSWPPTFTRALTHIQFMYLGQEELKSDHVGGCRVSSGDQKDERWPRPLDIFSSLWRHLLPWSPCSLLWWTELPGEASSSQGDGEEDPVPTTAQRYRIRLFPYRVSSDICHPQKARGQGARMRPLPDLIARTHVSKEGSTWQPCRAGSC